MKYFKIKEIHQETSSIVTGCMGLGGGWNDTPWDANHLQIAKTLILSSLDAGINFFDHADIYALGKSEDVFGAALKTINVPREKLVIQTKCGIRFPEKMGEISIPGRCDFSKEHIISSVENSLKRLKISYIDILLLHRPDPLVEGEDVAFAFDQLYTSGKVRAFGVSNHNPLQIEYLKKYLSQPIVVNQIQYSLLHTDLLDGSITGSSTFVSPIGSMGLIEYCRVNDIRLQAWSPFDKGIFFSAEEHSKEALRQRIENTKKIITQLSQKYGAPSEAILTAWILRHPAGIQIINGTKRGERVANFSKGCDIELTRDEWYALFISARGEKIP